MIKVFIANSGCAGHAWHLLQQSITCALRPFNRASASCGPRTITKRLVTVQEARLAQAARSFQFDSSLAPYNLAALQQWRSLSGYITGALIQKVAPVNSANLSVTTEADPSLEAPKTAAEERLAQQLKSKAHVGSGSGQSAPEAAPETSGAEPSDKAGSGNKQEAVKSGAKGIGCCFYTAVPAKATVGPQMLLLMPVLIYVNTSAVHAWGSWVSACRERI